MSKREVANKTREALHRFRAVTKCSEASECALCRAFLDGYAHLPLLGVTDQTEIFLRLAHHAGELARERDDAMRESIDTFIERRTAVRFHQEDHGHPAHP